jgi:hypothetical protein
MKKLDMTNYKETPVITPLCPGIICVSDLKIKPPMVELNDVSEWTIWIDDVDGQLMMTENDCTGRNIEVVARDEIMPHIQSATWALEQIFKVTSGDKITLGDMKHVAEVSLAALKILGAR